MFRLYILTNCYYLIKDLVEPIINGKIEFHVIETKDEFALASKTFSKKTDILFCFSHNIIVPNEILEKLHLAVNVHAAPPEYPGRDVHHFAIYNQEKKYGATFHKMDGKVDSGEIYDVIRFEINSDINSENLLDLANNAAMQLLERNLPRVINNVILKPIDEKWGKIKYTRKMFLQMCQISKDISRKELDKRIKAFHVQGYENLKINLYGKTFVFK